MVVLRNKTIGLIKIEGNHHSLASRHTCMTLAKIRIIHVDSAGPIAEGMVNQNVGQCPM